MKTEVELVPATPDDAESIHQMKYEAFLPLYEKYHDDETSPVKENIEKVIWQLTHPGAEYYLIQKDHKSIGAVRVKHSQKQMDINCDQGVKYISPIFILPEYQNQGIGQEVIQKLFELYPNTLTWRLDTIKQEAGNCHLYEKCGFVKVGNEHVVNEHMTLINYEKRAGGKEL